MQWLPNCCGILLGTKAVIITALLNKMPVSSKVKVGYRDCRKRSGFADILALDRDPIGLNWAHSGEYRLRSLLYRSITLNEKRPGSRHKLMPSRFPRISQKKALKSLSMRRLLHPR